MKQATTQRFLVAQHQRIAAEIQQALGSPPLQGSFYRRQETHAQSLRELTKQGVHNAPTDLALNPIFSSSHPTLGFEPEFLTSREALFIYPMRPLLAFRLGVTASICSSEGQWHGARAGSEGVITEKRAVARVFHQSKIYAATTLRPAQRHNIRRPASLRVQSFSQPCGAPFLVTSSFNAATCGAVSLSSKRTPRVALKNRTVCPAYLNV